jgi:hypothetical protein
MIYNIQRTLHHHKVFVSYMNRLIAAFQLETSKDRLSDTELGPLISNSVLNFAFAFKSLPFAVIRAT